MRCKRPGSARVFPWDTEEELSSLVKMVSISVRRQIEKALRPMGLTPQQSQTLHILLLSPGSAHTDLERILCIEKPSVTSLVTGLEKRGWVERRHHPEDARIKQIYLTEAGEAIAHKAQETIQVVKDRCNSFMSEEEITILKLLLKKARRAWE